MYVHDYIPTVACAALDVLPPGNETFTIASIAHIVSYKVGLMAGWYTPWVGYITI